MRLLVDPEMAIAMAEQHVLDVAAVRLLRVVGIHAGLDIDDVDGLRAQKFRGTGENPRLEPLHVDLQHRDPLDRHPPRERVECVDLGLDRPFLRKKLSLRLQDLSHAACVAQPQPLRSV